MEVNNIQNRIQYVSIAFMSCTLYFLSREIKSFFLPSRDTRDEEGVRGGVDGSATQLLVHLLCNRLMLA
jgi:hypothetical protein